jgi:hypothetical protein
LTPQPAVASSLPALCTVDLMTTAGSALFGAAWKVREAKIVERAPLPDAMPEYKSTYDIDPHAGDKDHDDSGWQAVPATELGAKRGGGYVSFLWFRAKLTIPARIGDFDPTGAGAVLTAFVDDYAEVWVNGELPRVSGRPSPARSRASTCRTPRVAPSVKRATPSARGIRHQRADLYAAEYRLVPRGQGRIGRDRWPFATTGAAM